MKRAHVSGLTPTQRFDVMSLILFSVTSGLRNVRHIVADAINQVGEQSDRVTRNPSSRQMSDFISYAKNAAVGS